MKILVYGYGNPGRGDDGMGPRMVEMLEKEQLPGVSFDSNYQLNIEDADNIRNFDIVIFVDASVSDKEPYEFTEIEPSSEIQFTTHAISPQSVVALCQDIADTYPQSYLMAIRGYEWEMMHEELSEQAGKNLQEAYKFLVKFIKDKTV